MGLWGLREGLTGAARLQQVTRTRSQYMRIYYADLGRQRSAHVTIHRSRLIAREQDKPTIETYRPTFTSMIQRLSGRYMSICHSVS